MSKNTMGDSREIALSFDVGGTFTDFVVVDLESGEVVSRHKVLTDDQHPARGVLSGWQDLVEKGIVTPESIGLIVHSTTIVTNALIERKGASTALLATKGFRDVLELEREQMYDIYDLVAPSPEPIIPRKFRFEIDERLDATGEVITSPSVSSINTVIEHLRTSGVRSVAISFLHSYVDPVHERLVATAIEASLPEVTISMSSSVAPLAGEYERTTTVAADAFTKPKVRDYVTELAGSLAEGGVVAPLHLMMSSGEIASAATAIERPIRLLESGPAAGAIAAAFFGHLAGHEDVLSLDMGGTTAKACVIEDGRPEMAQLLEVARIRRFMKGSGLPVITPVVDLIEIGAGGGSIARRDTLGLLKVGPDSAGANPGPACYGLGGTHPTVTDANLILGYLNPDFFLGGDMCLSAENACQAIARLGQELGLSVEETAWGIHRVVNENMASAARVHIIERNRDPRSLAIIAFGGAGPAHALAVARSLGSPTVVFPPGAGVASALGALVAPLAFTAGRTLITRLDNANWDAVQQTYRELEEEVLAELSSAGAQVEDIRFRRWAEMRIVGQYHEIVVELSNGQVEEAQLPEIVRSFREAYTNRYGRVLEGLPIEALHWRITGEKAGSQVQLRPLPEHDACATSAQRGVRQAYFPPEGFRDVPVYDRERMMPGMSIDGPAIIEEREATAIIWPGDRAKVDEYRAIVVNVAVTPEGEEAR